MANRKNVNMLQGSIWKNVIVYTVPIIFTGLLQLLFNAADIIVVGRFCGMRSVAAVGATGSIISLLVNFGIFLATGAGILVAQNIGAGNNDAIRRIVHTSVPTAILCGVLITALGLLFSDKILLMMNTPEKVLPLALLYMRIYFLGTVPNILYNFGAAILRADGDTRSPLIYLTAAGVVNVFLNLFFVLVLKLNVAGVAIATTVSQTLSAVLVLINLARRNDVCRLTLKKIRIDWRILRQILAIGIPAGVQSSMFSISNLIVQSSVNALGEVVVSGNSAAANLEGFVYVAMNAFHQTSLNFTGQNYGAGNPERVKKVLISCVTYVTVVGVVLGIAVRIFAHPLLSIYIPDSEAAIRAGIVRLSYICAPYFMFGVQDVVSGAVRGMGKTLFPMLISVFGVCVFRIAWIALLFRIPKYHTAQTVYVTYPLSWVIVLAGVFTGYVILYKKFKRSTAKKK